jgi:hypothetical protein
MTEGPDRMCPRRRLPRPRSYLLPPFGRTSLYRPRRSQRDHAHAARGRWFQPMCRRRDQRRQLSSVAEHRSVFPKLLGTFAAQTLAERYDADPSAADWRTFRRLPGFTNCKPKYRKPDGLFPFVRLHSHSGQQYPMAEAFEQEITTLYEAREQEHEASRNRIRSALPSTAPCNDVALFHSAVIRPDQRTMVLHP